LKTGSRYETKDSNGLSHFLEHMLFRGTAEFPSAHLLATAFEELGGTLDATTSADHGTLGIDIPLESLSAVLPLLASVCCRPLLHDLEIERGVIREEVLEDLGERGELLDPPTLIRQLAFADNPLGYPITGPLKNVERFTAEEIRAHHERTYVGSDTVISVAGPVDPAQIVREIEAAFSEIKRAAAPTVTLASPQEKPRFRFVAHPGNSQTNVSLSFRCPGQNDPMEPALVMLLRVLDDGMATRLYHELCDKRGLCYTASATFESYQETGLVELEADVVHENAPEVLRQMLRVTRELAETSVTDAEFERAKKRARWQHDAYQDEPGATADFFAMGEITGSARSPSDRLDQLLEVTKADIQQAAQRVFSPAGRNVVAVGRASVKTLEALALAD
jgi:predicted Zn-dependent peptidase